MRAEWGSRRRRGEAKRIEDTAARDVRAERKGAAAEERKGGRLNPPFVILVERARGRERSRGMKGEGEKRAGERASSVIPFCWEGASEGGREGYRGGADMRTERDKR